MSFYHCVGIIAIYWSQSSYRSGSQAALNLDRYHLLLSFFFILKRKHTEGFSAS